jgi:hypothetical protein
MSPRYKSRVAAAVQTHVSLEQVRRSPTTG